MLKYKVPRKALTTLTIPKTLKVIAHNTENWHNKSYEEVPTNNQSSWMYTA